MKLTDSISFITEKECSIYNIKITELESYWENHSAELFTLGSPVYLNRSYINSYFKKNKSLNDIIYHHFYDLYDKLISTLEAYLKTEVFYDTNLAIPGFHIFVFNKRLSYPGGGAHFDLQYESIFKYIKGDIDTSSLFSFTIPILLPEEKCGLNIWNFSILDFKTKSINEREILLKQQNKIFVEYKLGEMILTKGLLWHGISEIPKLNINEKRITLQGHGIKVNNDYLIYW